MISWLQRIDPQVREVWSGAWGPGTLEPDRYLYDHELVVVTRGSCRIGLEDDTFEMASGQAMVIPPDLRHRTVAGENGVKRFCVHFHWTFETRRKPQPIWCFFPERPRRGSVTPAPRFVPAEACRRVLVVDGRALALTEDIEHNWRRGTDFARAFCRALVLELLLGLVGRREAEPRESAAPARLAQDVKDLLDADPSTPVQELLPTLGFSYGHLCRLFHAHFGVTPVGYRNAVRLEKVRDLLQSSRLTVAEIAQRTGFDDPAYLSRIFRRRFNEPPSRMR